MNVELFREAVRVMLFYGSIIERNRVTGCVIKSPHFTRYQIYSDRNGANFLKTYNSVDEAINKFVELSQ